MLNIGTTVKILKPDSIEVNLGFKQFGINGTWHIDKRGQEAIWKIFVELVTRISVQEMRPGLTHVREALNSLYSLFPIIRTVLCEAGPTLFTLLKVDSLEKIRKGYEKKKMQITTGHIVFFILNCVLRPFLSKWHPELVAYEESRPSDVSKSDHEAKWEKQEEFLNDLKDVQATLKQLVLVMACAFDIPVDLVDLSKYVLAEPRDG